MIRGTDRDGGAFAFQEALLEEDVPILHIQPASGAGLEWRRKGVRVRCDRELRRNAIRRARKRAGVDCVGAGQPADGVQQESEIGANNEGTSAGVGDRLL